MSPRRLSWEWANEQKTRTALHPVRRADGHGQRHGGPVKADQRLQMRALRQAYGRI